VAVLLPAAHTEAGVMGACAPEAMVASLRQNLGGRDAVVEALLACPPDREAAPQGLVLFYTGFSTITGKPGLVLLELFVKQSARRKGMGRALVARMASTALRRGHGHILWTVNRDNHQATALYESLGALALDTSRLFAFTTPAMEALAKQDRRA